MAKQKTILVTGGAGFIGSNFVELAQGAGYKVIVYDCLNYAGHLENIENLLPKPELIHANILDGEQVLSALQVHQVDWLINFAAESHVDKSITTPRAFVETNVLGTLQLLTAAKTYFDSLTGASKNEFRFHQVSTDEVFGSLGQVGKFSEQTAYQPNSPYSASKAGGDHLVRAWFHTYGLPTLITNCSNNYGPKQFPEKLIPHMILCALEDRPLPVYGNGQNIRDWIHVKDHCRGLLLALEKGKPGETYCFGGNSERKNKDVVYAICHELDQLKPSKRGLPYSKQIEYVADRPGHDFRYAIDDSKAIRELGYSRKFKDFENGLKDTIAWYLENLDWCKKVTLKTGAQIKYDWAKVQA